MSITADAPVPFFTDTRTLAEKLGSDDREWRPHEPEHECPTAIFGLVLERGTYFSRFDKEHHTARVLTADNVVWSVIGFHGWLQSELERKNPRVGDFVGIAFTGTKPARREGESPAFTYRMEVVRNPAPAAPDEPAEGEDEKGGEDDDLIPFSGRDDELDEETAEELEEVADAMLVLGEMARERGVIRLADLGDLPPLDPAAKAKYLARAHTREAADD